MMPTLAAGTAERPVHNRIRTRSRLFAALFTGLLGLSILMLTVMVGFVLFYRGTHVWADATGLWIGNPPKVPSPDFVSFASLAWRFRIGGLFALVAQFTPAVMVLANLRGLFRLYATGTVFARENATHIKRIGLWLLAYAVAPFISVEFLTLIDCVVDRAWFHMVEVQALVLGGILLVIAQVMEAGREIELDRNGFV
jgi:hypothetical protein